MNCTENVGYGTRIHKNQPVIKTWGYIPTIIEDDIESVNLKNGIPIDKIYLPDSQGTVSVTVTKIFRY